jgi:putative sigma-54 modulation protein
MNIEFTARHFHAPENLRDYAEKEVSRITKYYPRAVQCQIILVHENNQFTTELNLSIPKRKLNVKETTDNITKSIDRAVKKMIQRISRVKTKQRAIN